MISIKKNFIYNFLLTGSNLFFPLLTFPYLTRILGAEGIGICNFITSFSQNFIIIAALGLPVYGVREIAKIGDDMVKRSELFFELLTIHLLFTGFLLIIYCSSVLILPQFSEFRHLALLGGMLIFFNVFAIEWLFSGLSDFRYITIRSLAIRILSVLLIFLFVKNREDYGIYFIITVATVIATALINISYSRRFISLKISLTLKGILKHLRAVILLGIYMVLTSIYTILPVTLLGLLSSKVAVGYYYTADKIVRITISIFTSLTTVMLPKLNLITEKENREEYRSLINKSLNFVVSIGIPLTFIVFLLAKPIILLLAGKEFVNSIFCLEVLSFVILVVAFAQVFVLLVLSVHRKDKEMVFLSVLGMLISLVINILFIPQHEEKAAAIAQFIAELIVTVIAIYFASRIIEIAFPYRMFFLNLLFAIPFSLITFIGMMLTDNNFLKILFSLILCGIYYFFYQTYIIKDKFIIELTRPYLRPFKLVS